MYPAMPASNAVPARTRSSFQIGPRNSRAVRLGLDPARAEIANPVPRNNPIHQVAITPTAARSP